MMLNHILISRTDAIGDVILTLPMAGYLKQIYPKAKVSFLGTAYTAPLIECSAFIDEFINYSQLLSLSETEQADCLKGKNIDAIVHVLPNKHVAALARQAGIKLRIGTTNRLFHWYTCNKLVRLSRKHSGLHEAQLNLMLLKPLGLSNVPLLDAIIQYNKFTPAIELPDKFKTLLISKKFNLILHPKSHGSGVEWGLEKFKILAAALPAGKFKIFVTGSDKEQVLLADWLKTLPQSVVDLTGQLSLNELIAFVAAADGLLASGTGPLHLAAALGVHALGLFPSRRSINPGRWAPLGPQSEYLESNTDNLESITVAMVADKINGWI
jgi:heptosyltransferase-3